MSITKFLLQVVHVSILGQLKQFGIESYLQNSVQPNSPQLLHL